jgi:hypothetical protein
MPAVVQKAVGGRLGWRPGALQGGLTELAHEPHAHAVAPTLRWPQCVSTTRGRAQGRPVGLEAAQGAASGGLRAPGRAKAGQGEAAGLTELAHEAHACAVLALLARQPQRVLWVVQRPAVGRNERGPSRLPKAAAGPPPAAALDTDSISSSPPPPTTHPRTHDATGPHAPRRRRPPWTRTRSAPAHTPQTHTLARMMPRAPMHLAGVGRLGHGLDQLQPVPEQQVLQVRGSAAGRCRGSGSRIWGGHPGSPLHKHHTHAHTHTHTHTDQLSVPLHPCRGSG